MKVKISQKTLEFLRDIITGDKKLSSYKSGPELVKFFNSLGFNDVYGQGFPSRWYYVETKLNELNDQGRISEVLYAYFSPINFIENESLIDNLVEKLNKYLKFDGFKLLIKSEKVKIVPVIDAVIETPTKLYELNNEVIRENIEKCDKKIEEGDFTGAITNARSLLETLLLYIYRNIRKADYNFTGDLHRLYKDVSKLLKLNIEKSMDDEIKKILGGLTSIVSGLSGVSNRMSDRHGRLSEWDKEVHKHLAVLTVNSVKTLSLYLYSCYEKIRGNDALRNI